MKERWIRHYRSRAGWIDRGNVAGDWLTVPFEDIGEEWARSVTAAVGRGKYGYKAAA